MQRFHQILFSVSLVALCWFGMMAVHELGHVAGAVVTGGTIQRVILYPLTISRTDVDPNPAPGIVVWLGPIVGSVLPLLFLAFRWSNVALKKSLAFFAGFCLIANGAYIAIGSLDGVGDCGEMLRTGTPIWVMIAFGAVAISGGLLIWHRLGTVRQFLSNPKVANRRLAYVTAGALCLLLLFETAFSPR